MIMASPTLASTIARLCPTQNLGPNPNGKEEAKCFLGSLKRDGLKSFASLPQISGSRCTAICDKNSSVPARTSIFPSLMSLVVSLVNITIGGYRRRVSLVISIICQKFRTRVASSRALICHSGCMAKHRSAQDMKFPLVSLPAT